MGRKREIPPRPKRIVFVPKDPKELEAALLAELGHLRALYEKGHSEALLHAVDFVLRHYASGSWISEAFAQRFEAWCRWEPSDLAEAFSVKRDNRRTPDMRRREELRMPIVSAIIEKRRQGLSAEEAIEQTAEEFKMSVPFVRDLYRHSPRTRKAVENLPPLNFYLRKSKTS